MERSYKEEHEAFMSGLSGGPLHEVLLLLILYPVKFILFFLINFLFFLFLKKKDFDFLP